MTGISVIIVSYNVRELLRQCLRSLEEPGNSAVIDEVIVVDNASRDDSAAMIRQEFPRVVLIENAANPGFTAANNQALRIARGAQILFLNPDAEVTPGALVRMSTYLNENPRVGVLGPKLRFPDGTIQSSRRRFPTLLTALLESTVAERCWPENDTVRHFRVSDRDDNTVQDVDWLVGACLLARREVVDSVGGFDERFFMYSEELDWCRRAKSVDWRVTFLPTAEVVHHEGKSSEQNLVRRAINFSESKCRYFEKYYGWQVGLALRFYLLANTTFEVLLELGKLGLGHKRQLRRARVAALARVAEFQARHLIPTGRGT